MITLQFGKYHKKIRLDDIDGFSFYLNGLRERYGEPEIVKKGNSTTYIFKGEDDQITITLTN